MGWLHQDPSGNFHVGFRYGGKNFKRSLKTKNRREAESRRFRLDESIRLIECGRLTETDDHLVWDIAFLLSGVLLIVVGWALIHSAHNDVTRRGELLPKRA